MMGSGTVAKMAMQNGRDYLGFDISPEYVELARKRVAWANPPLLVIA
jgi:site-specific DNA-methyltransferase (adenine-specific)